MDRQVLGSQRSVMVDPALQTQALQPNLRHVLWKPDPQRVSVTRFDPCFEHFCSVCGMGATFGFGGSFMEEQADIWVCLPHRDRNGEALVARLRPRFAWLQL